MENLPVRWYRHTRDQDTANEDLKAFNKEMKKVNIIGLGDSMIKFLPILGALTVATSGARIEHLARKLTTGRDFAGRRIPDVVIIMAGTNDVGSDLQGINEKIRELYTNIQATFPYSLKIVIGIRIIPRHCKWNLRNENNLTRDRKAINEMLMNISKDFKDFYFRNPYKSETTMIGEGPERRREINNKMYSRDGLHLSKTGKEMLALQICKIINNDLNDQIKELVCNRKKLEISWHLISKEFQIKVELGRVLFKGKDSLLSNFRELQLTIFNKTFQTPEAAYQYAKAVFSGQFEVAQAIQETTTGISAKTIADKKISPNPEWHKIMEKVMEHITLIRILNDPDLRRFLINNRDFLLVEDTSNNYWARGRDHCGKNILGKILNRFGQISNSEYELKRKLELTAFELDALPRGFYSKLIDQNL